MQTLHIDQWYHYGEPAGKIIHCPEHNRIYAYIGPTEERNTIGRKYPFNEYRKFTLDCRYLGKTAFWPGRNEISGLTRTEWLYPDDDKDMGFRTSTHDLLMPSVACTYDWEEKRKYYRVKFDEGYPIKMESAKGSPSSHSDFKHDFDKSVLSAFKATYERNKRIAVSLDDRNPFDIPDDELYNILMK